MRSSTLHIIIRFLGVLVFLICFIVGLKQGEQSDIGYIWCFAGLFQCVIVFFLSKIYEKIDDTNNTLKQINSNLEGLCRYLKVWKKED